MPEFTVVGIYDADLDLHEPCVDHVEADRAQTAQDQVLKQRGIAVEVVAVFAGHLQSLTSDWDNLHQGRRPRR